MTTPITLAAEGYTDLAIILRDAFLQASEGKGAERHANSKPFHEQPMQTISDLFDSDKGMAFQIVKKLREGLDMPEYERLERELLGVIVYTAGAILWHKRRSGTTTMETELSRMCSAAAENARNALTNASEAFKAIAEASEEPDMSDPANWLPGDKLRCIRCSTPAYSAGSLYSFLHLSNHGSARTVDNYGQDNGLPYSCFAWHSRPAK